MGLRADAEQDMREIHEDLDDFGWPVTVIDPSGFSASLVGLSNDVEGSIDPETGMLISGRSASVSLPMQSITNAGLGIPVGISDPNSRPWVVVFDDILGTSRTFKVTKHAPDYSLGNVLLTIEGYSVG
jgi:hypothetical protein